MSIQRIQQAVCYMEQHIYENIRYADVARSVHMSSYNFHRTFSFIAGMTANEYIRKRRLTLAAQELQATDISVLGAAYKYGYYFRTERSEVICAMFCGCRRLRRRVKRLKSNILFPNFKFGNNMNHRKASPRRFHGFMAPLPSRPKGPARSCTYSTPWS